MAMSRTYLGAHWLSDVIAGACIGTGLAVVWSAALELERARRRRRPPSGLARRAGLAGLRVDQHRAAVDRAGAAWSRSTCCAPSSAPARHRISEYANGPYGYVMTAAFVSIGTGMLALGGRCWAPVAGGHAPSPRRSPSPASHGGGRDLAHRSGSIGRTTDAIHSRASAQQHSC